MKKPTDPGHPHYAGFVESARRHLVRYGVDRDEAITLAADLTQKGFVLELDTARFKRFVDEFGMVAQTLQVRHQNNQATISIYEVNSRELAKEVVCLGFTYGGAVKAALNSVDAQRAEGLQFRMRVEQGRAQSMPASEAEMHKAAVLERQYGAYGQHPDYLAADWIDATEDGSTDKPYWQWVAMRLESVDDSENETSSPGIA